MIFESVIENLEIKKDIHSKINKYMQENSIAATGTSGLSIEELSKCYSENNRKRFLGIHFFNPPYNLPLCEIIPNTTNSKDFILEIYDYLTNKLNRKAIIVKDKPGFLANNIGFQFLNMALQYAEKYKVEGGIDYIDTIISGIAGRNMPPMKTIDFVGLDVHKAIVDNIYQEKITNKDKKYFKNPDCINYLLNEDFKGVKTKRGLYTYDSDIQEVFDLNLGQYRCIKKYDFQYIDKAYDKIKIGDYDNAYKIIIENDCLENKILMEMLLKYIIYSLKITEKVGSNIKDCDIAMAEGFNWVPPFALIDLLGGKNNLLRLIDKYLKNDEIIDNYDINEILNKNIKSEYNYRKYIKGKL